MSGFIQKAACSGRRPSQFAGFNAYQRSDLIARLLGERSIARFVVAPAGYGKTSLLVDYAETMFAWVHVFWVNGQSPCFIRDVDEGTIAGDCLAVDKDARLIIFDDVPALDQQRAQSFSDQIDQLLGAGCEVIVACTPRCDTLGGFQRDRVRIAPRELLLKDDELDGTRSAVERAQSPSGTMPDACRVAQLAWSQERGAASAFVKNSLREQMPADLLLAIGSMLVLHKGSLASLEAFGPLDEETLECLSGDYPHLGIDRNAGCFEAPLMVPDDLAVGIKGAFGDMRRASAFDSAEQLVWAWANALSGAERDNGRACEVVRVLCPRNKRMPWLVDHAEELVRRACFLEGFALAQTVSASEREASSDDKAVCSTFESVCRLMLGDAEGAVRCAKRQAFDEAVDDGPQICCLLVLARAGNELLRERAETLLAEKSRPYEGLRPDKMPPEIQLALSWRFLHGEPQRLSTWWFVLMEAGLPSRVPCLTASWLFAFLASWYAEGSGAEETTGVLEVAAQVQGYVRQALENAEEEGVDFYVVSAGLALERAHVKGLPLVEGPFSSSSLILLRRWEMALLVQRTRFGNEQQKGSGLQVWGDGRSADAVRAADLSRARAVRNVPLLTLKMFGRFEAAIGGIPIEDPAFRRKHVRLLLLILSAHPGRDMSRSVLAGMLWPDADEDLARRNLYAIWSKLRHALTLPDGTCPYLVRHQYGCSLDERYVQSDVVRLNEICRELLFGRPDFNGWTALYAELDRDFGNELLPSEGSSEIVDQIRSDCRSRLVDALVSATRSVIDGGNKQLAIWFARAAVGHDETREDAYLALMQAQIANSQRTAAMMTYHKCRRALADYLGMDPSPETTALYESLLDSL